MKKPRKQLRSILCVLFAALLFLPAAAAAQAESLYFSNSDTRDVTAEAEDAVITLEGDKGTLSDPARGRSGNPVVIERKGVYRITGRADGVSIQIREPKKSGNIYLILDNVAMTHGTAACIDAQAAEKVIVSCVGDSTLINTSEEGAAIYAEDDLTVNGPGRLHIDSAKNGIQSKSNLRITGAELTIEADNDGLKGKYGIYVGGGSITVVRSYEGMEAGEVVIQDGVLSLTASDDGINAAGKDEIQGDVRILGGTLYINATGDAIDSNRAIFVEGGTTLVEGPVNGRNSIFDPGNGADAVLSISGGTVIATGSAEKAKNFTSGTQYSRLEMLSGHAGDVIEADDGTGTALTATKDFQCVIYSSPAFGEENQLLIRPVAEEAASDTAAPAGTGSLSREGYTLEQTVVLSRHNIRSPLSGNGTALGTMTPHTWTDWSSGPSELTLRGGVLETEMGQYFRKWLEAEGLFPLNFHPAEDEVRIYANSKQRTFATAEYFVSGLLPTANIPIETHMEFDQMDPVFTPQLTFVTPEYAEDAEAQIWELYTDTVDGLADNFALISDVIDLEDSPAWKDGSAQAFRTDDSELILEINKEPGTKGSLKTACSVSDALVLQYYEAADATEASFGHRLTDGQWKQISEVKDVYVDVLFTAPLIAANVAHPLLEEIEAELTAEGRCFSFLCGHDSNVASVLAALGAEEYTLPGAIEAKTPIGCKLVFSRWTDEAGSRFCSVDLVYQTTEQMRGAALLDLSNPPAVTPLRFAGLTPNEDGLFSEEEFLDLLRDSIEEYDRIVETYEEEELDIAA